MRERVLAVRDRLNFANDVRAQEPREVQLHILDTGDGGQQGRSKGTAEDSADLGDASSISRKGRDTRDEQAFEPARQLRGWKSQRPRAARRQGSGLEQRPQKLLEVERVALCQRDHFVSRFGRELSGSELREQLVGFDLAKGAELELDDAVWAPKPCTLPKLPIVRVSRCAARRSDHQGKLVNQVDEAVDQLERGVIGPMDVVYGENDRSLSA